MKKILSLLAIAVVLAILYIVVQALAPAPSTSASQTEYFFNQMLEIGIERIGHPIEGFDASLWMRAFSGITPSDFDGVAALQGTYQFKNNELVFIPNGEPAHSAERTVSEEGMSKLLENLSSRLHIQAQTEADVDVIISALGPKQEERIEQGESNGTASTTEHISVENEYNGKIVYTTKTSQDETPFRAACEARGGKFNSCGTPCAPNAEICTAVCAFTCENVPEAE